MRLTATLVALLVVADAHAASFLTGAALYALEQGLTRIAADRL